MRFFASLALIAAVACIASSAIAQQRGVPFPGWGSSNASADVADPIAPVDGGTSVHSAPLIAEIDGNPANGKEVAIAGADGVLHVLRSDGSPLWSQALPSARCATGASNRLLSSPAVGNLFGNGVPYVLVGYGGVAVKNCDGGVAAFRGSDGKRQWLFSTRRNRQKYRYFAISHSVFSTPAIADTDGDGKMEVAFGSFDRHVYLLNSNGKIRWFYQAADTVWGSPAFADADGDGLLEVIIGTDISRNLIINPPTPNGGYLYALRSVNRTPKLIPFRDSKMVLWRSEFDQVLFSSSVIAEVISSNAGLEVIIGSGCYFPEGTREKGGRWVKVVSLRTGKVLRTLAAPTCLPSSVAVGDIDEDGLNEIVTVASGNSAIGGDGLSRLIAWKPETGAELWSIVPRDRGDNDSYGGHFASPIIADLDGNGSLEVALLRGSGVGIYRGADGAALSCDTRDCSDSAVQLQTRALVRAAPAVGDLNNDGVLELIAPGKDSQSSNGAVFAWTDFAHVLTSSPGTHPPYSAPWPMWRGNSARSGDATSSLP